MFRVQVFTLRAQGQQYKAESSSRRNILCMPDPRHVCLAIIFARENAFRDRSDMSVANCRQHEIQVL